MHRLLLLFAIAACGRTVTLTDDIDLTWDFKLTPFDRYKQDLHEPYVRGATLTMWASSDDDNDNLSKWEIVSSDPSILVIDDEPYDGYSLGAHVRAVGEGTVDMAVIDEHGERVGHGLVHVALPDRVELDAHGYLIVGDDAEAPVTEARIATGDTATYLVKYYQGDRELYGNNVLSVVADPQVIAEPRTSFLFEDREWLTLTPNATGLTNAQLLVDGAHVNDVQVIGVPASDITDVTLIGQSEKGMANGAWLVLLAQATDAMGRRVFGVDYHWNVDGNAQTADGDLYRYEYKKGNYAMVEVDRDGHTDVMDIQSDRGYVDNSNKVGCSAAGGSGSLVMCGVAALYLRRRRRSSKPTSAAPAAVPASP